MMQKAERMVQDMKEEVRRAKKLRRNQRSQKKKQKEDGKEKKGRDGKDSQDEDKDQGKPTRHANGNGIQTVHFFTEMGQEQRRNTTGRRSWDKRRRDKSPRLRVSTWPRDTPPNAYGSTSAHPRVSHHEERDNRSAQDMNGSQLNRDDGSGSPAGLTVRGSDNNV